MYGPRMQGKQGKFSVPLINLSRPITLPNIGISGSFLISSCRANSHLSFKPNYEFPPSGEVLHFLHAPGEPLSPLRSF